MVLNLLNYYFTDSDFKYPLEKFMRLFTFIPVISLILLLFFCSAASSADFGTDRNIGAHEKAPIIAAQIFVITEKDWGSFEKEIDKMSDCGINLVILRVFQNPGDRFHALGRRSKGVFEGVYFKTGYAPVVSPILERASKICHKHGVKIFAWMTTRRAVLKLGEKNKYRCKCYDFLSEKVVDSDGLTIFHPDVVKHLVGIYTDLAKKPIDGILFQDDLILRHNEDFSEAARKAFFKTFGYKLTGATLYKKVARRPGGKHVVVEYSPQFWTWSAWKCRWLMWVASRIIQAARWENTQLTFSLNLMYETIIMPKKALAWFSQALPEAIDAGFDQFMIMAYHRQMVKELNKDPQEIKKLIGYMAWKASQLLNSPSRVVMKLQTINWETQEPLPAGEIADIIRIISAQGSRSTGIAFAPYNDKMGEIIRRRFFQ